MRNGFSRAGVLLCVAVLVASTPVVIRAGTSNSLMDISADGTLLACSNRDSGTVTIVSTETMKVIREVRVGKHPEGVSFIGTSKNLASPPPNYADQLVNDAIGGSVKTEPGDRKSPPQSIALVWMVSPRSMDTIRLSATWIVPRDTSPSNISRALVSENSLVTIILACWEADAATPV